MEIATFKNMYIAELQELVSVEQQLEDGLQRMADAASHAPLRAALELHQRETIRQRERLQSILQKYGANPYLHKDQAMQALINETEKMFAILKVGELRDAGLIASAQKLEHYEIAAYGSAAALAGRVVRCLDVSGTQSDSARRKGSRCRQRGRRAIAGAQGLPRQRR